MPGFISCIGFQRPLCYCIDTLFISKPLQISSPLYAVFKVFLGAKAGNHQPFIQAGDITSCTVAHSLGRKLSMDRSIALNAPFSSSNHSCLVSHFFHHPGGSLPRTSTCSIINGPGLGKGSRIKGAGHKSPTLYTQGFRCQREKRAARRRIWSQVAEGEEVFEKSRFSSSGLKDSQKSARSFSSTSLRATHHHVQQTRCKEMQPNEQVGQQSTGLPGTQIGRRSAISDTFHAKRGLHDETNDIMDVS